MGVHMTDTDIPIYLIPTDNKHTREISKWNSFHCYVQTESCKTESYLVEL